MKFRYSNRFPYWVLFGAVMLGVITGAFWHSYTTPPAPVVTKTVTEPVYYPKYEYKYIDREKIVETGEVPADCKKAIAAAQEQRDAYDKIASLRGTFDDMLSESKKLTFNMDMGTGMEGLVDLKTRMAQLQSDELEAWKIIGFAQSDWDTYSPACS